MTPRRTHSLDSDTLRLEGALLLPDLLEKAAQGRASDQQPVNYRLPRGFTLQEEIGSSICPERSSSPSAFVQPTVCACSRASIKPKWPHVSRANDMRLRCLPSANSRRTTSLDSGVANVRLIWFCCFIPQGRGNGEKGPAVLAG